MLEIAAGGFLGMGDRHFLIPIDAITSVDADRVNVNQTRDRIVKSPTYDPKLTEVHDRDYWSPYYDHYGYSPYWGTVTSGSSAVSLR